MSGGHNSRRDEVVGLFEAAAGVGLTTHELAELLRVGRRAAEQHIKQVRPLLVKAENNGSRQARYWLARHSDAARRFVYPKTPVRAASKPKKARAAPIAQRCVALIRKAGRDGISTVDLANAMGLSREALLNRLQGPKSAGQIKRNWSGTKNAPAVWYMADVEPRTLPKTTTIRAANTGLSHDQPTIVPKGVKVTRGPSFTGNARYQVESAPRIITGEDCREWARYV